MLKLEISLEFIEQILEFIEIKKHFVLILILAVAGLYSKVPLKTMVMILLLKGHQVTQTKYKTFMKINPKRKSSISKAMILKKKIY